MSKTANTNPNFPAPPPNGEPDVDSLLDGLRGPIALDVKKTSPESSGQDAAEFQASARLPPSRADHETNPDARVIVETTPVPPVAEGLEVSPEERARMDAMFAAATKPQIYPKTILRTKISTLPSTLYRVYEICNTSFTSTFLLKLWI